MRRKAKSRTTANSVLGAQRHRCPSWRGGYPPSGHQHILEKCSSKSFSVRLESANQPLQADWEYPCRD
jgi:hypothetical protein